MQRNDIYFPHNRPRTRRWRSFVRATLFLILCYTGIVFAIEQNPYPFTSTADAQRFETLTKEIRCVVCQNQNIADSYAPLANDLREKVYRMVIEKKSDDEIKDYLVQRYGEFILLRPRLNYATAILWVFPFIGIAVALLFLIRRRK